MWVPFSITSQEMSHINFSCWGPTMGVSGWGGGFPHRIVLKQLLVLLCTDCFLENYSIYIYIYPRLSRNEFPKQKCPTCNIFGRNGIFDSLSKNTCNKTNLVNEQPACIAWWEAPYHAISVFSKAFFFAAKDRITWWTLPTDKKPFFEAIYDVNLVAPCSWEFSRGRGCGWESQPLSRFCFALVLKGFGAL